MVKKKIDKSPKSINQKRLVTLFKDIKRLDSVENRFCFLIGAGASKSSGIPTGWELSKKWYDVIKNDLDEKELEDWEKEIGFDIKKVGEFYPYLYKKRYESSAQVGYDEFKNIMESVDPGLGYVILSQILANEKHNFVITTNFDYLIEDAVRMYTSTKPFSAGHETLAEFISSQTERPTIIKVHRDLFLHPFNDDENTNKLKEEWKNALIPILKNFNLLVIGYGGNDGSLMDYLEVIKPNDRKPIYWCVRNKNNLNSKIKDLLTEKDYIVKIKGFDELMYSLNNALGYKIFENLDDKDKHQSVEVAKSRVSELNKKLKKLAEKLSKDTEDTISEDTKNMFKGSSEYIFKAYQEKDENKKDEIYRLGLERYPENADMYGNYAIFLKNIRKDYDKVEEYYKKAIELDPENANNIGNYALFLKNIHKNYEKAEEYYKKAIELDPESVNNIGNYAIFLSDIRKDYNKAEGYHKKGIELDPNSAISIGNYAHHLVLSKQDFKKAEKLIDKAIKLELDKIDFLAELWFYRYAHYEKYLKKAEKELDKLISEGAKSPWCNLQDHVEIAKKNKHPNIKKLQEFADKITKE